MRCVQVRVCAHGNVPQSRTLHIQMRRVLKYVCMFVCDVVTGSSGENRFRVVLSLVGVGGSSCPFTLILAFLSPENTKH